MALSTWSLDTSRIELTYALRKRDSFLDIHILPAELVAIQKDVIDLGTTGVKATAGGQYIRYGLETSDGDIRTVYCSSKTLDFMKKGGSIFYFRYQGTYLCLADTDNDRLLDGVYEVRSTLGSGIPMITHGALDGYEKIEPVPFRQLDPADFDNPIAFRLYWEHGNGQSDRILFKPGIYANSRDRLFLEGYVGVDEGQIPGRFSFFNLTFDVSSEQKNRAKVSVSRLPGNVAMRVRGAQVAFDVL